MKKLIVCTLVLVGSVISFTEARAQFGIRAGVNFSNMTGENPDGIKYNNTVNTGLHLGLNYSIPVAMDLSVRPELLYSEKGAKSPNNNIYKLNYLEVPINLLYKPTLGPGKLMLGFGPYVGFGLGGKVKWANGSPDHDVKFETNVTTTAPNTAYYNKVDAGINTLAGYEFTKVSVQLNAQLGLTDMYPKFNGVESNAKLKNSGFGLSLGYRF